MRSHRPCHSDSPRPSNFAERLRSKSLKVTEARQTILDILQRHRHPLTNKEILQAMPQGHCDLATIYRSMNRLEKLGIVKRFDLGDGAARFELLLEGDDGHHHHLVCTRCADIVELQECFLREVEERIASHNGFKAVTHRLEFFGICPQCQQKG